MDGLCSGKAHLEMDLNTRGTPIDGNLRMFFIMCLADLGSHLFHPYFGEPNHPRVAATVSCQVSLIG